MKQKFEVSITILLLLLGFMPCVAQTIKDADDNEYKTVNIGTQVWMAENLKVIKYNDGTPIPNEQNGESWSKLSIGAYCWYNNDDATNKANYGALYNWYSIETGKLCPKNWHVPTDEEWTTLTTFLAGPNDAGGKLKSKTGWYNYSVKIKNADGTDSIRIINGNGSNASGFNGIPGGARWARTLLNDSDENNLKFEYSGGFTSDKISSFYWSSTVRALDTNRKWFAYGRNLGFGSNYISRFYIYDKSYGFSVRCIKD